MSAPYEAVTIKRLVPSQNNSQYAPWHVYHKEKKAWAILIGAALPKRAKPPAEPVRMRITSYRNRLCDFANLVGGAKPIPDLLKKLGYLRDDNPRWFQCEYIQIQVPRKEERTLIEFLSPLTP